MPTVAEQLIAWAVLAQSYEKQGLHLEAQIARDAMKRAADHIGGREQRIRDAMNTPKQEGGGDEH